LSQLLNEVAVISCSFYV